MITPKNEYLSNLAQIQMGINGENYFPIPEAEKIHKIDLNTRIVEAPALLSVTNEHEAEILFFEVDRFFDNMDLLQTTCLINYVNAAGEHFIYSVPCVDAVTKRDEGKLLIPWVIESDVTWKAGTIKFAFQFYEINTGTLEFEYMLRTVPATTRVAQGLDTQYLEATEAAAADNAAGQWAIKHINYFIKISSPSGQSYRFQHALAVYNPSETYYKRAEEMRISDGTKLEAIYQQLDQLKKNSLKWVEI